MFNRDRCTDVRTCLVSAPLLEKMKPKMRIRNEQKMYHIFKI